MTGRKDPSLPNPAVAVPKEIRQTRISIVWVVPLVAAVVAGYLLFNRFRAAGPMINITFADGQGLQANQTVLRYRGVKVGAVRSVKLSPDGQRVEVAVRLDSSAARLACSGSIFWLVRPEVNAAGLHGLETIVSGTYIQVEPGLGPETKKFIGNEEAPMPSFPSGSLEILLTTPQIGTLNAGAPVYYRGLEVGAVQSLGLNQEATAVHIHLQIKAQYAALVRQNTEFWNAGGLNVSLKLFGINVSAESMRSLIVGGISFATPSPPGRPVGSNNVFVLHEKPEDKWLKSAPPMAGWAGSNGPPTNAPPANTFPSVHALTTNGRP